MSLLKKIMLLCLIPSLLMGNMLLQTCIILFNPKSRNSGKEFKKRRREKTCLYFTNEQSNFALKRRIFYKK